MRHQPHLIPAHRGRVSAARQSSCGGGGGGGAGAGALPCIHSSILNESALPPPPSCIVALAAAAPCRSHAHLSSPVGVGAAAVLTEPRRLLPLCERCCSGTLSYIFNELSPAQGKSFSEVGGGAGWLAGFLRACPVPKLLSGCPPPPPPPCWLPTLSRPHCPPRSLLSRCVRRWCGARGAGATPSPTPGKTCRVGGCASQCSSIHQTPEVSINQTRVDLCPSLTSVPRLTSVPAC